MKTTCSRCETVYLLRIHTDGSGGVYEEPCPSCERRAAGICRACSEPVAGKKGRAIWCATHRKQRNAQSQDRWRAANPGKVKALRKRRLIDPEKRARRKEWEREYRSRPEVRRRILERKRRDRVRHPERYRERARRYRDQNPEKVEASWKKANAKRAAAKREHMHIYGTKYVGLGRSPRCRKCGGKVPYLGKGRPRMECPTCDPARWVGARVA